MNLDGKKIITESTARIDRSINFPERSYAYDKLDEIMTDQKSFIEEVYTPYNNKLFSCYNFTQNNFNIWYSLMRAQSEVNEAAELIPSKTWKYSDNGEISKETKFKLLEEIIDAQKFLNQAIIRLGFNAQDVYEMHMKKSKINRKRQEEGY